jgi:DHA1 family tetracycline resistance protein-like MFS transporter
MAFGLGSLVGPAIGGLLGGLDPRLPFRGLRRGLSRQCGVRVVRATRIAAAGKRMAFSWKRANPVGSLKLLASQRQLLGLASVDFLGNFAHQFLPAVFVLYAGHRYG